MVTFATTAILAQGLESTGTATQKIIHSLRIDPKEEHGETNIGDAIALAQNEFLSQRHSQNARKVLVLLTDGKATGPGNAPEAYALKAAEVARAAGIAIFTIGLGNEVNDSFLAAIASDKTREYKAASAANLSTIYQSISTALCEEGATVIDVIPKTPLR